MYQPLEHIKIDDARFASWRCRVPFCWGDQSGGHGVCAFHAEFANRQIGEPFHGDEDATIEEQRAAYSVHRERELKRIPYHLLMASLWPGIGAKERHMQAKREKTLKEKWNDRGRDD
jgi:hypothetical protein